MSDLISRADAIEAVEQEYKIDRGYMVDDYTYGFNQAIHYVSDIILHDLPSAETHEIRTETHGVCSDLISREDVLEGLKHSTAYLHDDIYTIVNRIPSAETTGALDDAIAKYVADGLMELPSADAEWIPCSERLPDEGQGVIVTVDDNVYKIKVGSCIYSNGRFHSLYNDLTVTAWMPLPTPYKGGDTE